MTVQTVKLLKEEPSVVIISRHRFICDFLLVLILLSSLFFGDYVSEDVMNVLNEVIKGGGMFRLLCNNLHGSRGWY